MATGTWDGYGGRIVGLGALGGPFAAVAVYTGSHYGEGATRIVRMDIRTGKRRSPVLASPSGGETGSGLEGLTELAVSRYGTVGWLLGSQSASVPEGAARVMAHDSRGTRQLDGGPFGDVDHVRFQGADLAWRHGSEQRSAQLAKR